MKARTVGVVVIVVMMVAAGGLVVGWREWQRRNRNAAQPMLRAGYQFEPIRLAVSTNGGLNGGAASPSHTSSSPPSSSSPPLSSSSPVSVGSPVMSRADPLADYTALATGWEALREVGGEAAKFSLALPSDEYLGFRRMVIDTVAVNVDVPEWVSFPASGTVLGAVRHHLMIAPWDDDMDWACPVPRKSFESSRAWLALKELGYDTGVANLGHKIWNASLPPIMRPPDKKPVKWGFPYLDIFSYKISGAELIYATTRRVPLSLIFPFRPCLLGGVIAGCPQDLGAYLTTLYGDEVMTTCYTGWLIHRKEQWKTNAEKGTVACSDLSDYYPFVRPADGDLALQLQFQRLPVLLKAYECLGDLPAGGAAAMVRNGSLTMETTVAPGIDGPATAFLSVDLDVAPLLQGLTAYDRCYGIYFSYYGMYEESHIYCVTCPGSTCVGSRMDRLFREDHIGAASKASVPASTVHAQTTCSPSAVWTPECPLLCQDCTVRH